MAANHILGDEGMNEVKRGTIDLTAVLSMYLTDRQMQIEQKIFELQGLFSTANGSGEERSRTRAELKEKIEMMKNLRESEWAYGGNGEVPNILID
ncbi:hypothetical protein PM082_018499 [Marasmius tenuissimus]|nr:hypothetical protein PM082_018499 [Marasmius tenuissimus]